jgi:hypothetical protein
MTSTMTELSIALFLAAGFVFGLLTYSRRHLFGEGPPQPVVDRQEGLSGLLFWVAICTFLWPIQVVGGLHGLWRVYAATRRP